MLLPRTAVVAFAAALSVVVVASAGDDGGVPKQSRPQQLAQSCRTQCVQVYEACARSCDSAAIRIDCLGQCQTQFNLCTSLCR